MSLRPARSLTHRADAMEEEEAEYNGGHAMQDGLGSGERLAVGALQPAATGYATGEGQANSRSEAKQNGNGKRMKRQRTQNDKSSQDGSQHTAAIDDEGFVDVDAGDTDQPARVHSAANGKRKSKRPLQGAHLDHEDNDFSDAGGASAMPASQTHAEAHALASGWATAFLHTLDISVLRACLEYLGGSEAVAAHGRERTHSHSAGGVGAGVSSSAAHPSSSGASSGHYASPGSGGVAAGAGMGAGSGGSAQGHADSDHKAAIIASLLSNFGPSEIGTAINAYLQHKEDAAQDVIVLDDSDEEVQHNGHRHGHRHAAAPTSSASRHPPADSAIDVDDDVQFIGTGTGAGVGGGGGSATGQVFMVESQDQADYDAVQMLRSNSKSTSSSASLVDAVEAGTGDCGICYDDGCAIVYLGRCKHTVCRLCALRSIRMKLAPGANSCPCTVCEGDPKTKPAAGSDISGLGYISEACMTYVQRWSKEAALLDEGRAEAEKELGTERPLSEEEAGRFSAMLVRAAVQAIDGTKLVTCPNLKCGESMASDATRPAKVQCPSCATGMCRVCGLDWEQSKHDGQSCEATQGALSANQDAAALMGEGSEVAGTFKRCPVCGTGIEHRKGHGCHHITCAEPTCRAHWCWVCCGPFPCTRGCPGWCTSSCGCVYCRDCKYDAAKKRAKPCSMCADPNSCLACKGKDEADLVAAEKKAAKAREKQIKNGNAAGLPRTTPPEGVTKDSYNSLRRRGGVPTAGGMRVGIGAGAGGPGAGGQAPGYMGGLMNAVLGGIAAFAPMGWGLPVPAHMRPQQAAGALGAQARRRDWEDNDSFIASDDDNGDDTPIDGDLFDDYRHMIEQARNRAQQQQRAAPPRPVLHGVPAQMPPRAPLPPAPAVWDPLAPPPRRGGRGPAALTATVRRATGTAAPVAAGGRAPGTNTAIRDAAALAAAPQGGAGAQGAGGTGSGHGRPNNRR